MKRPAALEHESGASHTPRLHDHPDAGPGTPSGLRRLPGVGPVAESGRSAAREMRDSGITLEPGELTCCTADSGNADEPQ